MLTHAPRGLDEIIAMFGSLDNPRFEAENIVEFALPYPLFYGEHQTLKARAHKKAVANFQWAFEQLALGGLRESVRNFSGIYAERAIRGFPRHPSTHAWGIAIDLEAERYPLESAKRFPDSVVGIFAAAGFTYGGDFRSRLDPMHFQLASAY